MARWITFWQGFGKCLFYFTSFSPQTCSDILSSQNLICVFNLCFWSQNRNVASSTSKKIFQRLLGTIGVFQRTSWKVSKREFNICANPSSAACATFDNRPTNSGSHLAFDRLHSIGAHKGWVTQLADSKRFSYKFPLYLLRFKAMHQYVQKSINV